MPTQSKCRIIAMEPLNAFAWSMTVEAGDMARQAVPGQFVQVKCGHSRMLRRPISICDINGEQMRLVFEVRGEGTEWLSRREVEDDVDLIGPLGRGFDILGDKLLLVGGGIGLPPMLYTAKASGGEVHVIAGFRSQERAMLTEDFLKVAEDFSIASDDGSIGYHGFVDALVRQKLEKEKGFTSVLACGPKPMLRAITKAAEEFDVPVQVSMEERMACGVGACLGCAVPMADGTMKHVCKDGPIFNAKEVDWNA